VVRPCLLILLILASASYAKPGVSDKDLIGVWEQKYDGVGAFWFSHTAFLEDGRKCVLSYWFNSVSEMEIDYYLNSFKVENNQIITTYGFSSTELVSTGFVMRDRIEAMKDDQLTLLMLEPQGENLEFYQRLSDVDPESICKVVENYKLFNPPPRRGRIRKR